MAEVPEVQEQEPEDQEVVEEEVQEEDVEGKADGQPEEQAEGDEPDSAPRESRRNRDIRVLRERAQAAEQAARAAQEEAARIRWAQSEAQRQQEEAKRAAELNDPAMPYDQRLYKWAQKRDEDLKRSTKELEDRLMDQSDRASYEAKAAVNPMYAKYRDAVERQHSQARANGTLLPREACLKWILGEERLNPKTTANLTKQKQQAQSRVAAARGQPNAVRSDAGNGGRARSSKDEAAAREERLRDVLI